MSVAFIFPAQGAQYPGMLHDLLDDPTVDRTLDEVSDALRYSPLPMPWQSGFRV